MITQKDRDILKEIGIKQLLDIVLDSKIIKEQLTFKEHIDFCKFVMNLTYEEVITLVVTEDIKDFESKFKKFLKYGFAAIAGLAIAVSGPVGWAGAAVAPPLAMFVLYIFRKLTDTCSRSCINKFPMSTERKICRYECQVTATRRIVNDLRSEMTKCGQFANPQACEKKLRKEYVKWSRRLQQQIIKLRSAQLGREEKRRKKRQKELSKRAKALAASYHIPQSQIVKLVSESSDIRNSLTFRKHIKLYNAVSSISEEDPGLIVKPPKIDPNMEKKVRTALYLGLWVLPVPFFNDIVNYIIKKYNFSCVSKCVSQRKFSRRLCYHQCSYLSARYAVSILNKQLPLCNKAKKPVSCKKKVFKMLEDWKQREVEAKIKFEATLKDEITKAKQRNIQGAKK